MEIINVGININRLDESTNLPKCFFLTEITSRQYLLYFCVLNDKWRKNRNGQQIAFVIWDYYVIARSGLGKCVPVQPEVFVYMLSHSVGLGFSQTVALKPKSRLTAHHHDCGSNRITLAHLSVTHTTWAYKQPDCWRIVLIDGPWRDVFHQMMRRWHVFCWLCFRTLSRVHWHHERKHFTH